MGAGAAYAPSMFRRKKPTRDELIERKHQLDGEIRMLAAEVKRLKARGADATAQEARLSVLRSNHHKTRLQIDRTTS